LERRLPFENAVNFRDLGGYVCADGRRVKWNRLYRCGHMGRLTESDLARLAALEPAVICDFRTDVELANTPSRLPPQLHGARHHLEIGPAAAGTVADVVLGFTTGALNDLSYLDHQIESYREIINDFAHCYAAMFRLMDDAQGGSVIVHCTAGKDRTGIAAGLILHALGVPRDTIMADYLLTNECPQLHGYIRHLVEKGVADDMPAPPAEKFARVLGVFGAKGALLDAAFAAMVQRAGSVDGYIRDVLGVTDAKRARLRAWFVES